MEGEYSITALSLLFPDLYLALKEEILIYTEGDGREIRENTHICLHPPCVLARQT